MYHPRSPQRAQVFFMQSLPEPAAGADLKTLNNSLSPPQAPIFFYQFHHSGTDGPDRLLGPAPRSGGSSAADWGPWQIPRRPQAQEAEKARPPPLLGLGPRW